MVKQPGKTGVLYIVATPIGNLEDVSARAIRTLGEVDLIAAEDTRLSRKLTNHYGIQAHMVPYHDHNETQQARKLVNRLMKGQDVALICDAGTPLISDAGYRLVRLAQQNGILVTPIPGPCAAITALSTAGLPTDRFIFEGFLPVKTESRRRRLQSLKDETRTLVFYESVHRIVATLRDMVAIFDGDREAVVARELTKQFETIKRDSLTHLLEWLTLAPRFRKGEFVILVHGRGAVGESSDESARVLSLLLEALPTSQAVDLAAGITGTSRNTLYRLALKITGA